MSSLFCRAIVSIACLASLAAAPAARAAAPCRIEVVDRENGWPVPLVELSTTNDLRLVTDNAGLIALDEPELMNREIWFDVAGHGYGVRRDGFGHAGLRLTPRPGETLRVEVDRTIIARRVARLTGGGLFAESQKLGLRPDHRESGVFGCDTVQVAAHRGKLHWLWGDTDLPSYALGVFHSTSATTALRPLSSFEPPASIEYDYFRNEKGAPRGVAVMPGAGPTWVTAMVSLPDRDGQTRLVGTYAKIKPPLEAYEYGLCVWNDEKQQFERHRVVWEKSPQSPKRPLLPDGHAALWRDDAGREWLLIGNPFPNFRCPATFEAWENPAAWEALEPPASLRAAGSDEKVEPSSGSIAWNQARGRWVTIFMQKFGKPSAFGELWYAESPSPTGPWGPAVKVLSHDNYTFYNPRVHPELTAPDAPFLLFEGTYTSTFADRPPRTPRYDYNQVLYRLDLDDPRLAPAQAAAE
jgi:hypothetical protein